MYHTSRREFLKKTGLLAAGVGLAGSSALTACSNKASLNSLPQWKGFNLLDFFNPDPANPRPPTQEEYFKWMVDWGFDFVRIPMAYPYYVDFDRSRPIRPDEVYQISEEKVEHIEALVDLALSYGLHVNLNLHRAPGYCINAGFDEPYNLWFDEEAQQAFNFHWDMWARKYQNVSRKKISFDLVNEPAMREDMNNQHSPITSLPGDVYRHVVKHATKTIHSVNPDHLVIAGGNDVGATVVPELLDLPIGKSCRGYYPGLISHYKAPWAFADIDNLPEPKWPGQVGDEYFSRAMLDEFFAPWVEVVRQGVGVHCGECGCYNKTPHDVFLAWFSDLLSLFSENGIGFALWEFSGDFGLMNSRREDVDYEDWYGHKLDRKLLDLLRKQ
ncbi:cellulase family glycosylhydrolase [Balneolaceae bacterium ANBcel3]|nr:cellulase family glycosylhydrolase [Balneolaceae bacterium ANBcel3]